MEENYLDSIRKQFQYYQHLGDQTFAQLAEIYFGNTIHIVIPLPLLLNICEEICYLDGQIF